MEKEYGKIDWSKLPEKITDLGDTNCFHFDCAVNELDTREINMSNPDRECILADGTVLCGNF